MRFLLCMNIEYNYLNNKKYDLRDLFTVADIIN